MTSASTKIAVLSDTHGHMPRAVLAALHEQQPDAIIHAGDSESEHALSQLELIAPVLAVQGNCDWHPDLETLPLVAKQQWGNSLIVVSHRPQDVQKTLQALPTPAQDRPYVIGIHGHTHVPKDEWRSKNSPTQIAQTLLLCPGSPVEPREGSEASIALLTVAAAGSDTPPQLEFINL